MQEFMLFIHTEGEPLAALSAEEKQQHVQKVGAFIQNLIKEGKMKDAQPLKGEGISIFKKNGAFHDGPFNESKEVIVGYYHILAEDMNDAMEIAKSDPRFEGGTWRIEIRPILKIEGIND